MKVFDRIYVSGELSCQDGNNELAVLHACKYPCHKRKLGYEKEPEITSPGYLTQEDDYNLYLNITDSPDSLSFKPELFKKSLAFMSKHWLEDRKILIHCNQGISRSPSLALLFGAKHCSELSNESYQAAKSEFELIYPDYDPGQGIQEYLDLNWDTLSDSDNAVL